MLEAFRRKYRTLNTTRVSESALLHNLNLYRKLLPNQAICPVLKSNAYGHGLTEIAKILESEQPEFFLVDSLYEAYELKKAKIKTPILILGYTHSENLENGSLKNFHFTAGDIETARTLAKLGVPVHLEVDTGMSRTGFPMADLKEVLQELKTLNLNLVGLFSHLADADNPIDQKYTTEQCKRFRRVIKLVRKAGFDPKWIHTCNSAGALKTEVPDLNMARIGISLYGVSPLGSEDPKQDLLKHLKPVMEVVSTIIAIRDLKAGESVSYGCTYKAPQDMRIGVIPFGYYEGIPRSLSSAPPFLGNICMNHAMIDLTHPDLKPLDLNIGDEYIIYSTNPNSPSSFQNMAKKAGTIPWELMTGIAESIRRETVNMSS